MSTDDADLKFLPGIPPAEAGCPPPNPRVEHDDGMRIEYDVAVPMRDGVRIYVDVFRPESGGPVAPIIAWGPYGKHGAVKYEIFPRHGVDPAWISQYTGFEAPDPVYWSSHGYAVINVDPRGTWNSEGDATFYSAQEARDMHDLIEWAGTQAWSNGKVGMSGVSYLAISQWRAGADRPPHLAALNPWEGVSDRYREMAYHGGIPESSFGPMWRTRRVPYSNGRVEDLILEYAEHPLFDEYWASKVPDLAQVEVPAFVVASWSDQGLHTRGTLEGYKQIASTDKWLLIHARKKWQFYHQPESVELLRSFFDRFLLGRDTDLDSWPRVRLEVRERFYEGEQREYDAWPLSATEYRPLHLDAERRELVTDAPVTEGSVGYAADASAGTDASVASHGADLTGGAGRAEFDHVFEQTTDLIGPMRLRLWVEAEGSNDIDLFVAVQKLDADGALVPFSFLNALEDGPVALGWLRVSHRELDEARTTEGQPWHTHTREQLLRAGEVVPVDIEIWPSGTRWHAGERLRLVVQGSDIYTYPPGTVHMAHSTTRNAGTHLIHTGGRYDSHLLIPVVPASQPQ